MNRIVTKTVLLGDRCKSDYRKSFFGTGFYVDHVDILGAQHSTKQIEIDDTTLDHQIWEISSERKFKFFRKHFFQGVASLIIVLNEINKPKLESLKFWFEEMSLVVDSEINLVMIINDGECSKTQCMDDLTEYCEFVKTEYGLNITSVNCYCSSLDTGKNIDVSFRNLSVEVLKSIQSNYL